jgi:spore maturation protein SpmA
MVLNYIWIGFFIIAFIVALFKLIFLGDTEVFSAMMKSTFDMAETGFKLSIGLTGALTLWLGIMRIGEKGGIVNVLSRIIGPFFKRLFPELPSNHPAVGSIMMNVASNMMGLDNAATPLGLKAMKEMQATNKNKPVASNAMIMFLVLNTSGLTILPISIMVYRAELGAVNPADIFIPILIATYFSTLAGLISVSIYQKINLLNKVVLAYIGVITAFILGIIYYFSTLSQEQITSISTIASNIILFSIIIGFILLGIRKKINIYENFIEGAKDGFWIAVKIIPYLIAILVAIGVFRTSGTLEALIGGIEWGISQLGINTDFVPALPTGFMKPLSGSGARGMMVEAIKTHGVDSFIGRLTSVMQGSTETTFYVIALYFGTVGIKRTRHAVTCGLIADFTGVITAILIAYLFFH